ncbi:MAG TPA: hypothetical protein VGB61_10325, partial [Pyrinomonadaceae bacterium]
ARAPRFANLNFRPWSEFQLSVRRSIHHRDTEDTEGAQRVESFEISDLIFQISDLKLSNDFLCAPSALSVSAVVNASNSL